MHVGIAEIEKYATIAQTLVTIPAVVLTSWAAVRGLTTWRTQLLGGATMEVSRSVLRAVFRVRSAMLSVRHPFFPAGEMIASDQAPWQREGGCDYRKLWNNRWQRVTDVLPDLETAAIEAQALWGSEAKDLIDRLNRVIVEFSIDLEHYLSLGADDSPRNDPHYLELRGVVYGSLGKGQPDPFKDRLDSIVGDIEQYARARMSDPRARNKP